MSRSTASKPASVDERDDLLLVVLTSLPFDFDRVASGELAAVGDGAVEVVRAEVEGGLGESLAEHDPVGFDVVEVVEHQARDGDGLKIVDARRAGQMRELRARRVEGERDEALKAARLVLLLAQPDEMVDAVFDGSRCGRRASSRWSSGRPRGLCPRARASARRRICARRSASASARRRISAPPPGHESIPAAFSFSITSSSVIL